MNCGVHLAGVEPLGTVDVIPDRSEILCECRIHITHPIFCHRSVHERPWVGEGAQSRSHATWWLRPSMLLLEKPKPSRTEGGSTSDTAPPRNNARRWILCSASVGVPSGHAAHSRPPVDMVIFSGTALRQHRQAPGRWFPQIGSPSPAVEAIRRLPEPPPSRRGNPRYRSFFLSFFSPCLPPPPPFQPESHSACSRSMSPSGRRDAIEEDSGTLCHSPLR